MTLISHKTAWMPALMNKSWCYALRFRVTLQKFEVYDYDY